MTKISEDLAAATVLNRTGEVVPFRTLYENGRTLIVFVRHFGCIFCRERIGTLSARLDALRNLNMNAVVIGNGTAAMADAFAEETNLDVPLYTDPGRRTYALAGMKRNLGLSLTSIGDSLRSWRSGHRQGAVAGDVWQQGGILVVDSDGNIIESHHDDGFGDYIDLDALMDGLRAQTA